MTSTSIEVRREQEYMTKDESGSEGGLMERRTTGEDRVRMVA
jgi:hypothetical protein